MKNRTVILTLALYLMHLLPTLAVLDAEGGMVMKENFADFRIGLARHREVARGKTLGVPVVWRRAQLQEGARKRGRKKH